MILTEFNLRIEQITKAIIRDPTTAKNIQVPNPRPPTWASEISFIWPVASVIAERNDNVTLECIFHQKSLDSLSAY